MCPSELCLRMMIFSSSNVFLVLIVSVCVTEGTLEPGGMVLVDCGSTQIFTCRPSDKSEPIGWNIAGLSGINFPRPFNARAQNEANRDPNDRFSSNDTGGMLQTMVSVITISGFSTSDNGGIIQCVNINTNSTRGMATISVDLLPLPPPTSVVATVRSCDTVTLQWTKPSQSNDITTSVSCTPPSPGCAGCTTSPCNITGLNASTEYVFTVTLNSGQCRKGMSSDKATTDSCTPTEKPDPPPTASSASLAALVLLLLPIPLLYPLGVLVAYLVFFKDKSYCEVFWCCFFWRKDKSYEMNSTELREHREEAAYQNVPKKKEVVTNGDEIKESKRTKQEEAVTHGDEVKKPRRSKQEGVITDETVQLQGTPDGHHEQKRSHQHKEEVEYQNLSAAKKQEAVTNGDEVKKPRRSKQEVVSTGNVMQQQGNPDGIEYADLDFSEQGTGRNMIPGFVDPVTYAEM